MPNFRSLVLIAGLPLFLAACNSSLPVSMLPPEAELVDEAVSEQALVLAPDDQISVTVDREPGMSLPLVTIGPDGFINVPATGPVRAAGVSSSELSAIIERRLAETFLQSPRVGVNVVTLASRRVTIEGAVAKSGVYSFGADATLLDAIAMAGGATRAAKLRQVAIFRTVGNERSVAVFDLQQVRAGQLANPRLYRGDKVVVGFSGLGQAWQDILLSVPLIGVFTRF